jgi:hypothetical protein
MKGESGMVALLSYALRREQRALSWCRVSREGTNIVRYRTIIRMTRGFLGICQILARLAAVFRAIGACCSESRLVVDNAGSQIGGLAASKRGNSLLGLHQRTLLLSSSAAFAPLAPSCRCARCPEPTDQRQDVGEHPPRHRNLGHLEEHVSATTDFHSDLDQLFHEAGQRPRRCRLGHCQCAHEIAEIVREGMELKAHGVGGEGTA